MKYRYHALSFVGAVGLGASLSPLYHALFPSEPPPPSLVSVGEIVATVRADAFLVSSRTEVTAPVTVKSGVDISTNNKAAGWLEALGLWWDFHRTRDRLTVSVTGEVLAGFDLKKIDESNVVRHTAHEVVFNLGTPEFLGVIDDEKATKTIKRETGMFRLKEDTLYLAAESLAEEKLISAACHKEALKTAGTSGAEIITRITNLLRARNDTRTVHVIFTPGRCTSVG